MPDLFPEKRERLLAGLAGDVLEIGGGNGYSLVHYPPGIRLVFTEPGPIALSEASARVARPVRTDFALAGLPKLPFDASSFDAAVVMRVLCSVDRPGEALAEVRRVLRPGGRLVFMEHVRSPKRFYGLAQDVVARPWRMYWKCWANRDAPRLFEQAGFAVEWVERFDHGPWPVRPRVFGVARLAN
jgi:SAM-dependent methyltransferase